ncbi:MAG: hypothetical protein KJ593_00560 [Candidatus Omnitrophica bacterium]|nr:hypothetical protein [Candidatus Omnitrophota bacterium]
MKQNNIKPFVILGKIAMLLPTLIVLNLFFGWVFFGFYYWLLIEIALIFLLMFTFVLFGKGLYTNFFKHTQNTFDKDVIDVEGGSLDEEEEIPTWHPPVSCPKCYSKNTHFVEPHYEMSVYECENCKMRFETEE